CARDEVDERDRLQESAHVLHLGGGGEGEAGVQVLGPDRPHRRELIVRALAHARDVVEDPYLAVVLENAAARGWIASRTERVQIDRAFVSTRGREQQAAEAEETRLHPRIIRHAVARYQRVMRVTGGRRRGTGILAPLISAEASSTTGVAIASDPEPPLPLPPPPPPLEKLPEPRS